MPELETLSAFLERTSGFTADSLPRSGGFSTNPNLPLKVRADGTLEPFMGNTVVFPLPEDVRRRTAGVQDLLYRSCAPTLARRLDPEFFHITLHDLLSGTPSPDLERRVSALRGPALERVRRLAARRESVRLRSTALFNMVGSSMVLGFAPVDNADCKRLMSWYEAFQELVPLDYPLTPHVTVAYFRPGVVSGELLDRLRDAVDAVRRLDPVTVTLSTEDLAYQTFSDMDHYRRDV